MKRILICVAASALVGLAATAVPVKRSVSTHVQSDGTILTLVPTGDEWFATMVTADDRLPVGRGDDGNYYYRTADGLSTRLAHNMAGRDAAERAYVSSARLSVRALADREEAPRRAKGVAAPRKVGSTQVPVTGSPRVPIILVQYQDKKMSNTVEAFKAQYTSGEKSAYQYFADQSNGKYTPQFDVYGIYTLDGNRADYGAHGVLQGRAVNDVGVATMVGEAIDKAGNDINWSLYDNDNDGEADVCIVVYAGVGEAQAYNIVPDAVWPCQWTLSSGEYYGDGDGNRRRNGKYIDRFAVFNELNGSNDNGTEIDGVGTFCHEFSHCLGLPDFYETTYDNGYYGMGAWSLMDYGCYNDDGHTPIGYSAYEKSFMGWVTLKTPAAGTHYSLPVWNGKNADTDVAYKIVSPKTSNEYFILENRRKQGWDAHIADEGMLIEHVSYLSSRWNYNTVNNEEVQLMTIVPADNVWSTDTEDADCYGNSNHEFTDDSTPAATLNMSNSYSAYGNAGLLGKPVTDINVNADGTVDFWYIKPDIPTLDAPVLAEATDVQSTSFTAQWAHNPAVGATYTLQLNRIEKTELLFEDTFAACTKSGSSAIDAKLDSYTDMEGWTGSNVYQAQGGLRLGSNSGNTGTLATPPIGASGQTITVKFKVKAYGSDTSVPMTVSYGTQSRDVTVAGSAVEELALLFDAEKEAVVTFATTARKKRAIITEVQVYSGNATQASTAPRRAVTVTDNLGVRTIAGIEGTGYTVTDLTPGATYEFCVRAWPAVEGTAVESVWSNVQTVTLHQAYKRGDVNGDGSVGIADVTALINIILEVAAPADYLTRADVNEDGSVAIADITSLVNIILSDE